MDPRALLRAGAGIVAGLALIFAFGACGGAPTDPGSGNGPTLMGVYPSSGATGDRANTVDVSLIGTGFEAENLEVSVNGRGVEVANVSVVSDTSLTADFLIAGGAPTGDRSVTVATDAGTSQGATFSIVRDRGSSDRHVIKIYDNYPEPTFLEIEAGGTVVWKNVGRNDHTVSTYGTPGEWKNTLLEPDQTFQHTFNEPGEYGFICALHQVVGNVTVHEPGTLMDDDGY